MTHKEIFRLLIQIPWIVFVVYWIIGALKTRTTRESESAASRIAILLVEIAGYVLLFNHSAGIGVLGIRFMHRTLASVILGVALIWLGIGGPSGPVITWPSTGAQGSRSRRTTSLSAPAPTLIYGTRFIPAWFWRR